MLGWDDGGRPQPSSKAVRLGALVGLKEQQVATHSFSEPRKLAPDSWLRGSGRASSLPKPKSMADFAGFVRVFVTPGLYD